MKTKTFIEKVKELGFRIEESDSEIDVIHGVFQHVCHVSKIFRFVLDTYWTAFEGMGESEREDLYKIAVEYARTPLEEREEEKKYRYKFKAPIKTGGGGENLVFHLARCRYLSDLKLDASGNSYAKSSEAFHFTDKQVEEFTDEQKLLIQLCEKIEVTP